MWCCLEYIDSVPVYQKVPIEMNVNIYGKAPPLSREIVAGNSKWHVPEEVPIAFVYNRRNYAVMMGTPADMKDFALGFSLTEAVVKDSAEIKSLDVQYSDKGVDLRFKVTVAAQERLDMTLRRRNLVGAASCGLCGLENADVLFKALPQVAQAPISLDVNAINKSFEALWAHQPLNKTTRSVHAAAWVQHDGTISYAREDVGRHNALDKLLGAMAADNVDVKQGYVLMSSRCSYEIVEKAAQRGVQAIVSISGPTVFALRKAQEAHMAIYSRSENGAVQLL